MGKDQLDPIIHVERVIDLLLRKYTILSGSLRIDYLFWNQNGSQEAATPMIDRIINVCSALVNLVLEWFYLVEAHVNVTLA